MGATIKASMCGRYTIERAVVLSAWPEYEAALSDAPWLTDDFNIAPTMNVTTIRTAGGMPAAASLRWGLVPFFAKGIPGPYTTFNAQAEKLETAPSWRGPWRRGQRCLMLATGFYEWQIQPDAKTKIPHYITCVDQPSFAFAGIWDRSVKDDGTAVESVALVTLPPNELMAAIHNNPNRPSMPAILGRDDVGAWLNGTPEQAKAALRQYPSGMMLAWPVRPLKGNGPGLITKTAA